MVQKKIVYDNERLQPARYFRWTSFNVQKLFLMQLIWKIPTNIKKIDWAR